MNVFPHKCISIVTVAVVFMIVCAPATAAADVLYGTDFEKDPLKLGWWRGAYPNGAIDGAWSNVSSVSGRHCIVVSDGWWASPRFEVQPLTYYRLHFSAMVEGKGYWFVIFYDHAGQPLDADHYSSIYPTDDWQTQEFCFRSRVNARTADVRFRPINDPLYVDDLVVETIARPDVAAWADRVYAGIPPIDARAVPRAGKYLQRTMRKLRSGETLLLAADDAEVALWRNTAHRDAGRQHHQRHG
jgi:hypothetical protein